MKKEKEYVGMDAVKISYDNDDIFTTGTSNCVLTTQMETSPNGTPCDLTPEDFWQNEWWGDNTHLNP